MKRIFQAGLLCLGTALGAVAAPSETPNDEGLYVRVETNLGSFVCRLEFERVPRTVANFVTLVEGSRKWVDVPNGKIVEKPLYDGLTFIRVSPGFVIQGGSPDGTLKGGPGYRFRDEFHADLNHQKAGILSMANSGPDSNGSQFFITLAGRPDLDGLHSVFGEVVSGMETIVAIGTVAIDESHRPLQPVVMESLEILRIGEAAHQFDPFQVVPPLPEVREVHQAIARAGEVVALTWQAQPGHRNMILMTADFEFWRSDFFNPFGNPAMPDRPGFPVINNLVEEFPRLFFKVVEYSFD